MLDTCNLSGACISEDRGLYVKGMYSAYIQDGGTGQIKLTKQTRWGVKARVRVCVILFKFNELFKNTQFSLGMGERALGYFEVYENYYISEKNNVF